MPPDLAKALFPKRSHLLESAKEPPLGMTRSRASADQQDLALQRALDLLRVIHPPQVFLSEAKDLPRNASHDAVGVDAWLRRNDVKEGNNAPKDS